MTNHRHAQFGMAGVVCLLLTLPLGAQQPVLEQVQIESVAISSFDAGGVDLRLGITGIARTTATLTQVVIDDLTVGEVHLAAQTVSGPVILKRDEAIRGLDRLTVRVSYDDIPSLTPLRDIARNGHARLRATIRGTPSLNFVERLMLMGREPVVVARLDQDVSVVVPGGLPGQMALQSTLALAEPFWGLGRRVTSMAIGDETRAGISFDPGTVALETRYRLRASDGTVTQITRHTAGFLLDERTVLATAESVEPWLFDPVVAPALRDGSLRLVDGSREIYLASRPANDGDSRMPATEPRGEDPQTVRVAKTLDERVQAIAHPTRRRFELRLRNTLGNAALLDLQAGANPSAPRAVLQDGAGWQPVAIPRTAAGAKGTVLHTAIRWNGRRYEIRDRIDRDQFGAPIVTERGIVGMVQDERSGVPLADVLPKLGWQAHATR